MSAVHPPSGHIARAFAALVRERDPAMADVIEAQAVRLANDTPETRAREAAGLESFGRPLWFGENEFANNLLEVRDGSQNHVWCFDDDTIALGVGSRDYEPHLHAVDLIRLIKNAFATGLRDSIASMRVLLFGPLEPIVAVLDEYDASAFLQSVTLRPQHPGASPCMARVLPALQALEVPFEVLSATLGAGHPSLETLVVYRATSAPTPTVSFESVLRVLERTTLPSLRHLGICYGGTTPTDLRTFVAADVVSNLTTLDVYTCNEARSFPFDELLDSRERLSHLKRVVVGGHLVPPATKARFRDWPEVTFASHDRCELVAFDLETKGWSFGSR